ncbi:Helix-turn-helix domain-containing protein [Salipiger profundus]|nr:Helix-turn-helix domain-containing protein [Salipiger profundus]
MSQVWASGPQDRCELLVLLALADFSDHEGRCWPSMKVLAAKARTSERGAQKIVARLVEAGWLEIKTGGGRGGTNVYRILPISSRSETPNDVHPKQVTPPEPGSGFKGEKPRTGEQKPRTGVQETPNPGSPEPSGTIKEPSRAMRACERAPARERAPDGFEEFWAVHPRPKNRSASERAFSEAVAAGADPKRIVAEAERYRAENRAGGRRYLCATDVWLSQRRWEARAAKSDRSSTPCARDDIVTFWAGKVLAGEFVPTSAISSGMAREMLRRELVTADALRAAGVST